MAVNGKKIGLVLGAGGARGFAHLGVLEELEKNGIEVDLIVGSSIGSIVGAFYADYGDVQQLKSKLLNLKNKDILDFSFFNSMQFFFNTKAPFEGKALEDLINNNLSVKNIEQLKTKFIAVAIDLRTGNTVELDHGSIAKAVRCSSTLPPIYTPVKYQGKLLVDGGFSEPVPVNIAKKHGMDFIIAVDISNTLPNKKIRNMVDVMYKTAVITNYWLCKEQASKADFAIYPKLDDYDILDDKKSGEIYQEGVEAMRIAMPELLSRLNSVAL